MKLEELKEHVDKLKLLLDDPSPGTFSWCEALGERMNALVEAWTKKDPDLVAQSD